MVLGSKFKFSILHFLDITITHSAPFTPWVRVEGPSHCPWNNPFRPSAPWLVLSPPLTCLDWFVITSQGNILYSPATSHTPASWLRVQGVKCVIKQHHYLSDLYFRCKLIIETYLSHHDILFIMCIRVYCWNLIRRCGIWTPSLTFSEVSWSLLSRVISSGTQS